MENFLTKFPEMPKETYRAMKKGVDAGYKSFAREYGGYLANRSFGGAQVSRTFYARGQTGQQLLLGAYSALIRQMHQEKVKFFPRHEMLDIILDGEHARGITVRNLINGEINSYYVLIAKSSLLKAPFEQLLEELKYKIK